MDYDDEDHESEASSQDRISFDSDFDVDAEPTNIYTDPDTSNGKKLK